MYPSIDSKLAVSFEDSVTDKANAASGEHFKRARPWESRPRVKEAVRWGRFRCDWAYSRPLGRLGARSCLRWMSHSTGCETARSCRRQSATLSSISAHHSQSWRDHKWDSWLLRFSAEADSEQRTRDWSESSLGLVVDPLNPGAAILAASVDPDAPAVEAPDSSIESIVAVELSTAGPTDLEICAGQWVEAGVAPVASAASFEFERCRQEIDLAESISG